MGLVLLLGGARSGKSDLAVRIATEQPAPVTLIATAEAGDSEMRSRIARHRAQRPANWKILEAPLQLEAAVLAVPPGDCLLIDCLTLWAANLLREHDEGAIQALTERAARAVADRRGRTLVVSNEVGLGIVPDNPLARRYRDILGRVNTTFAAASERAYLLVAGRLLALEPVDGVLGELGE